MDVCAAMGVGSGFATEESYRLCSPIYAIGKAARDQQRAVKLLMNECIEAGSSHNLF
jgi:hypothetical protein